MRWRKFKQISFGVGKTVNHSFSRGKLINIGIQVGSLNNDQPHYFPHLSKLLSFFPLVFSGWIQSLEASEVYFKIAAILSIEHPPDKPKASEIISDSITFYTWMRLFLGLFICLFDFIQGLVEKFIFELCVEEDYLYSIRLIHTLIHTLTPIPACHRARSVTLLSPDNLAFFPGEMAERSFLLRATSILVTNFRVHHLALFLKTWANIGESYCTEECSKRTLTVSSFLSHFVRDSFLFCVLPYMADST